MAAVDLKINQNMAKVTLKSVPDKPGIAAEVFSALGEYGINVELLSTIATGKGKGDILFAVPDREMERVKPLLEGLRQKLGSKKIETDAEVSLISLYGEKLSGDPSFSSRIFKSLAQEGINLQLISQSVSALSFLVDRAKLDKARAILKSIGDIEG